MSRFIADLRSIAVVTPKLEAALIDHLGYYWPAPRRNAAASSAERERQRDAVAGLRSAGRQLQQALRRADAAFAGRPPLARLEAPVGQMLRQLEGWTASQRQRRGRPQDIHRQALRLSVFNALASHGLAPTRSCRGPAAQVLLVVFDEADRRDGNPPEDDPSSLPVRASRRFSREQWAAWLNEYRADVETFRTLPF